MCFCLFSEHTTNRSRHKILTDSVTLYKNKSRSKENRQWYDAHITQNASLMHVSAHITMRKDNININVRYKIKDTIRNKDSVRDDSIQIGYYAYNMGYHHDDDDNDDIHNKRRYDYADRHYGNEYDADYDDEAYNDVERAAADMRAFKTHNIRKHIQRIIQSNCTHMGHYTYKAVHHMEYHSPGYHRCRGRHVPREYKDYSDLYHKYWRDRRYDDVHSHRHYVCEICLRIHTYIYIYIYI